MNSLKRDESTVPHRAPAKLDGRDRHLILECNRLFEAAARAWERGNNSGDPRRLEYGEDQCDRLRAKAVKLITECWPGITVSWPGLYPYYSGPNWSAFHLEDAVRHALERARGEHQ